MTVKHFVATRAWKTADRLFLLALRLDGVSDDAPRCPDCGLAPDPGEGECPICRDKSEAEYVERQMYAAAYEDGYHDARLEHHEPHA